VLSQWLQRLHGSVVQGPLVSLSRSGLLRVSESQLSRAARVQLPVVHGGQAAVVKVVDETGAHLALRVQAVSSAEEKSRQMERLVNMTTVASAARERPDRFPSVLPVVESFVLVVPGDQIPVTGADPEYELWCDLMPWCPGDLNGWARATPVGGRHPGAVLGAFVPMAATVHAVHEDLGIVHRDITPNNVLVDERGRLLLADWGIAHGLAVGQTSTYTQLVGNRGFSLPPEMLAGDPSVGRYTDAWYLGSLLSWMLTGQPPGPQHGPDWLPPGLPGGPAGEQVQAVVRGLCWPDPRGRMDLGRAQTLLTEAAAGRASMTGPFTPAVPAAPAVGPTAPFLAANPSVGHQSGTYPTGNLTTANYATVAYPPHGFAQAPRPAQARADAVSSDAPSSGTRRGLLVAVAVVVVLLVVGGGAWGVAALSGMLDTPSASSPDKPPSSAARDDPTTTGGGRNPGNDTSDPPVGSLPVYSAERMEQIADDLVDAVGGPQVTWVVFYEGGYVIAYAPLEPGSTKFDEYTWRDGKVTHGPLSIQPDAADVPKMLFDLTTVDWTVVEPLVDKVPELAPEEPLGFVSVHRPGTMMSTYSSVFTYGVTTPVMFTVATHGDYGSSMIYADAAGKVVKVN